MLPVLLIEVTDIFDFVFAFRKKVFMQFDKIIVRHACDIVHDDLVFLRLFVRRFSFARIIRLV